MDRSIELCLLCHSRIFTIEVDFDDVAISSSNDKLRLVDDTDCPCTKCTQVQVEDKHLCLYMESTNISRGRSCIYKVLSILWKSHANVFSDHGSGGQVIRGKLACLRNQAPQSHFLCSTDSELIILRWSKLDVFSVSTPCQTSRSLIKDWWKRKGWYYMAVSSVPDKHLSV